jgi:hypothetical protein
MIVLQRMPPPTEYKRFVERIIIDLVGEAHGIEKCHQRPRRSECLLELEAGAQISFRSDNLAGGIPSAPPRAVLVTSNRVSPPGKKRLLKGRSFCALRRRISLRGLIRNATICPGREADGRKRLIRTADNQRRSPGRATLIPGSRISCIRCADRGGYPADRVSHR